MTHSSAADTKSVRMDANQAQHRVTLPVRSRLALTITFFSMFFGAGNLIFPPFLGALAGTNTPLATFGFICSAVGLPILGVLAVTQADGFERLAGSIGPRFAAVLAMAIMLTIGPFFAIPRTATTSFEMAIAPHMHSSSHTPLLVYSLIFFALAWGFAQFPGKLSNTLGKITGPVLLVLIAVLTVGALISVHVPFAPATGTYQGSTLQAFTQGFIDGYQTMDLLAALYFGIIIGVNIRAMGVTEARQVRSYTAHAGLGTGIMLTLVYAALAVLGALSGALVPLDSATDTGATALTHITHAVFGQPGTILVGLIFIIACLNVCTGLISTCSTFMTTKIPHIGSLPMSYRTWSIVFALFSLLVSNAGLSMIIKVSIPVLIALYPIAIVLVIVGLASTWIRAHMPYLPMCMIIPTTLVALADCCIRLLELVGVQLSHVSDMLHLLPGFDIQLGWIVPALIGAAIAVVLYVFQRIRSHQH